MKIPEKVAGIASKPVAEMVLSVLSDCGVVGVAENHLVAEIAAVMAQFVFDCGKLGIKFVSFPRP